MAVEELRDRQLRAARNQGLFREVNERLEALNEGFEAIALDPTFLCECAQVECVEQITMTLAEYEALRKIPNRFAVKAGHVFPEVERIVEQRPRYVVVEKVGAGGVEAVAIDPRSERG